MAILNPNAVVGSNGSNVVVRAERASENRSRIGGAKLDEITDRRTGQRGELRFAKGSLEFTGYACGQVATSKNGDAVKTWIVDTLKRPSSFAWIPIIEVEYPAPKKGSEWIRGNRVDTLEWDDDPHSSFNDREFPAESNVRLEFGASRYLIGCIPGGEWRSTLWTLKDKPLDAQLEKAKRFSELSAGDVFASPLDVSDYGDRRRVIVAYSEELWMGLTTMVALLKNARQQIYDLLSASATLENVALAGRAQLERLLVSGDHNGGKK